MSIHLNLFERSDDLEFSGRASLVSIDTGSRGDLEITIPGCETKCGEGDPVIILEKWEGELRLLIWNDINREGPLIISLEKAKTKYRQEDT